ncbi:hypothetical protein PV367_29350 [Streptomyces europaeiscabiei]|uniref:Uncharacterized protein n=1 Tax=Streptomyces europaeiscabiei TaxID=146819 RepID=A0AAJ2PUR1_9ACTN|nr:MULTISPECIES: hypothetical protein [Streptomyces]KFF96487.1 hypothetical protein IQ62_35415 [Streptomyces scabiei]MDX3133795.1 hypothetical protein [Streptomyces europaeiscabiei]MDX3689730.1 hypothetical protein [Streptomyces europaeiscabiei]
MHSSTSSRRLSVLAFLALGSAAATLILGTAVGASAGTRLVADDGLPDIVKPKDPATGSIEPGVIVPGHKVTWTWDDKD